MNTTVDSPDRLQPRNARAEPPSLARRKCRARDRLAVTAYLEGFELAEPQLANSHPDLLRRTEQAMMSYRNAVKAGDREDMSRPPTRLRAPARRGEARSGLRRRLSAPAGFVSSLVIILREGLEAILVLAAMGAFLVKTERREGMPWLHAGWIVALLAGALTWVVVQHAHQCQRRATRGDRRRHGADLGRRLAVRRLLAAQQVQRDALGRVHPRKDVGRDQQRRVEGRTRHRAGGLPRGVPRGVRDRTVLPGAVAASGASGAQCGAGRLRRRVRLGSCCSRG